MVGNMDLKHRIKKGTGGLILLLILVVPSSVAAVSLTEIIEIARTKDSKYLSERALQHAELEQLPQAKSFFYPTVSANYSEVYTEESLFAPDLPFVTQGSADYRSLSYGVRLRQVLFNREVMVHFRLGKLAVALAAVELRIIENNLILRTAKAYFAVLNARAKIALIDSNIEATLELYKLTQKQLEQRVISSVENQQAKGRWLLSIADKQIAANNLENALLVIEALTDSSYKGSEFQDLFNIKAEPLVIDDEKILGSNLEYLKKEILLEIAKNAISVQKAKHSPTLQLLVDHSNNNKDGSLSGPASESEDTRALIQLSVPLFKGGRIRSLVRAEKHRFESAQHKLTETKKRVLLQNRSLFNQLIAQDKTLIALNQALEANQLAMAVQKAMFLEGIVKNKDVLDAQKEVFETSVRSKKAQYDRLYSWFEYLNNTGNLIPKIKPQ